jgi:glutathione S-transferase
MHLYHCNRARSMRVVWTLEEMGLDYDVTVMPFPPRVLHKEFKQVNPLGTIPYLIDGETEMSESAACCQYIVQKYGPTDLNVSPDETPAYGEFLNWLYRADATLAFPLTLVWRYTELEPEERLSPQVAEDYRIWFLARWRSVDTVFADGREWLCGDRFTIADICVGWSLMFSQNLGVAEAVTDNVKPWWDRLQARPAYQRSLEV